MLIFFLFPHRGLNSTDVDECAKSTLFKCPKLSRCSNTDGGYTCICQDGYFTNESGLCEGRELISNPLLTNGHEMKCKIPVSKFAQQDYRRHFLLYTKAINKIKYNSTNVKKIVNIRNAECTSAILKAVRK